MKLLDARSERALQGVHPYLVSVLRSAHAVLAMTAPGLSFVAIDGVRTLAQQKARVAMGASRRLDSFHLVHPTNRGPYGLAADVMVTVHGSGVWAPLSLYARVARRVLEVAEELGHKVAWGGDWDGDKQWRDEGFFDGGHFQLEGVSLGAP